MSACGVASLFFRLGPTSFGWSSSKSSSSGSSSTACCFAPLALADPFRLCCCCGAFPDVDSRPFRRVLSFGALDPSSSGTGAGGGATLGFLFDVLLAVAVVDVADAALGCVVAGGGVGSGAGGEARRFVVPFGGLPAPLLAGAGAGCGVGSGSGSCSDTGVAFTLFDARVKRKSPSCSSKTAAAAKGLSASVLFLLFVPPATACVSNSSWLGGGRDERMGSDVPARRLLCRRPDWLLMLKTCSGWRVRTRVVMDGGGAVGA